MPPDRYTEADLLYAMEHAGRLVDDAELKKRLENGLGTPATRADIIEKLIQNNCIERRDKELVPTAKGRELVRLVPAQLKSAELTGKWEQRLFAISNGEEKESQFVEDIKKNATDLVNQVIANHDKFDPNLMGDKERLCPSCGWPMMTVLDEYDRPHHVCQRFSCGYEEMEVKKRVETEPEVVVPTHASASPTKKILAVATPGTDGKKRIVIKKAAVKAAVAKAQPQVKWETVIEVVKPSHYRPPRQDWGSRDSRDSRRGGRFDDNRNDRGDRTNRSDRRPSVGTGYGAGFHKDEAKFASSSRDSAGGTFADFIRASEERKKRDEEKRRKK